MIAIVITTSWPRPRWRVTANFVPWAEGEIDNLRAAHTWSLETAKQEFEKALRLVSSLYRFWVVHGRMREGIAGFEFVFNDERYRDADLPPSVWIRAVAHMSTLAAWITAPASLERAQEALVAARELGDKALTARCLGACGAVAYFTPDMASSYLEEAADLARACGDKPLLCDIRSYQAVACNIAGEPAASRAAAEEGRDIADSLGDGFSSRHCRIWLGQALGFLGDLAIARSMTAQVVEEAQAAGEDMLTLFALISLSNWQAALADAEQAVASSTQSALAKAAAVGGLHEESVNLALAISTLVAGDARAAREYCEAAVSVSAPQRVLLHQGRRPDGRSLVPLRGCHRCATLGGRSRRVHPGLTPNVRIDHAFLRRTRAGRAGSGRA